LKSLAGFTYEEVAYEVCSAFARKSVVAVLVGGGAATFYAPKAYQTRDLDFVLHLQLFGMPKATILSDLGFTSSDAAGTYEHSEIPYTLEILRGPLAIGEEILSSWDTHTKGELILHVISPTDSVKDRLGHGIHFADLNAVRQAAEVAKLHPIDLGAVRAWCEKEGGLTSYHRFETFL